MGRCDSQFQRDLATLRATFSNLTSNNVAAMAEVQALKAQGGLLQEMVTSLKSEVENHKQDLQAGHSDTVLRVQQLAKDLKALSCQMATLQNNGSRNTCCAPNWLEYEGSCYWFSRSGKSWPEADKYCQLESAHLVVVNSREEQKFIQHHMGPVNTWMGLTDQSGPWKWVDGTDYETGFKNWRPEQPDDWYGHGLGGGEDCAHFTDDGRWNDDVCQRPYRWVCEAARDPAT